VTDAPDTKGGSLRIVLVDDDADHRLLLRRLFTRAGCSVVAEAGDAEGALGVVAAHLPDLVVLDIGLPGRSGVDVLPELLDVAPDSRVVMLSGFPRAQMGRHALGRGAVGYVEKGGSARRVVHDVLAAADLIERATRRLTSELAADRRSARSARELVRELLEPADQELLALVELLVTELVTNAVVHASSAPRVQLLVSPLLVRVEVFDRVPELPRQRVPDVEGPGGRGLLVLERMATRWGAEPVEGGKVVWFEVDRAAFARP
jgi:DNA-binding NarL/FixJ family response regulator